MPQPTKSDDLGIEWQELRARYDAGESLRSIAKSVGLSHTALNKRARQDGWKPSAEAWKPLAARTDTARRIAKPETKHDKIVKALGNRTPENMAIVLTAIEQGMAFERAGGLIAMTGQGIRNWMRGDPDFAKLVQHAIAKKEQRWLNKVEASQAWQAATWQLERDRDTRDGYTQPHQGGGPTIAVNISLRDEPQNQIAVGKVIDA